MTAIFDSEGRYVKTEWKTGDTITADKLDKIESCLEAINNNDIDRHMEADNRLDILEESIENSATKNELKTLVEDTAGNIYEELTSKMEINNNCIYMENFNRLETEQDDTGRIQRAIDYACERGLKLTCKGSSYFECSSTININKPYNIDFSKAHIKSNATIAIDINVEELTQTQSKLQNVMIDCEECEVGIRVSARRVYMEHIYLFNIQSVGLSLDGGYEIDVTRCNFRGISSTNKAIVINTTDNYIYNCYGTDNNVFVENNAVGNIIVNCHSWIFTTSILSNSVFAILNTSAHVDKCVIDTYSIGIKTRRDGTSRITGCDFIVHPDYLNSSTVSSPPMFIYFTGDEGNVYRTVISNNRISFPSSSETGFDVPGYLYNIDKELVMCEINGNTGYYVDFCNGVKIDLSPLNNNISTLKSYAIRKNNRVAIKCYCAFSDKIPSDDTVVFNLPIGMRPFTGFYAFGAMGSNINNISKTMFVYVDSNGDIKVKNNTGDDTMSQGVIILEFDVWQPGIE